MQFCSICWTGNLDLIVFVEKSLKYREQIAARLLAHNNKHLRINRQRIIFIFLYQALKSQTGFQDQQKDFLFLFCVRWTFTDEVIKWQEKLIDVFVSDLIVIVAVFITANNPQSMLHKTWFAAYAGKVESKSDSGCKWKQLEFQLENNRTIKHANTGKGHGASAFFKACNHD